MIERLARAMCRAVGYDPDETIHGMIDLETGKETAAIPRWRAYAVAARAALVELREPTEGMWMAGRDPVLAASATNNTRGWSLGDAMEAAGYSGWATEDEKRQKSIPKGLLATLVWRAMIRAAEGEQ